MSENGYYCEKCHYSCNRKFLWTQHLRSKKHNNNKKTKNCTGAKTPCTTVHTVESRLSRSSRVYSGTAKPT